MHSPTAYLNEIGLQVTHNGLNVSNLAESASQSSHLKDKKRNQLTWNYEAPEYKQTW